MSEGVCRALTALRLPASQQQEVLTMLKAREDRRHGKGRVRFNPEVELLLEVSHPGGSNVAVRIYPRDLSERGMGFLLGNFLYPESTCSVMLRLLSGKAVSISGKVIRCELVRGRVHEVGMRFDQEVDVSQFADVEPVESAKAPEAPKRKWRKK